MRIRDAQRPRSHIMDECRGGWRGDGKRQHQERHLRGRRAVGSGSGFCTMRQIISSFTSTWSILVLTKIPSATRLALTALWMTTRAGGTSKDTPAWRYPRTVMSAGPPRGADDILKDGYQIMQAAIHNGPYGEIFVVPTDGTDRGTYHVGAVLLTDEYLDKIRVNFHDYDTGGRGRHSPRICRR